MNKIFKIFLGTVILLTVMSCATYTKFEVYERTFDEQATAVNIDLITGDVHLKESSNDKIRVEIFATEDNHHIVDLENKTLNIRTGANLHWVEKYSSDIFVYLPKNYDGGINTTMITGDFDSANFENASLNLGIVTGDAKINKIDSVKIDSTTGDIKINSISNKANIKLTTGDITIENASLKEDSKIRCITGDVTIENIENVYIETHTTTGQQRIFDNDRHSDVTLEISVTTGKINVN